MNSLTKNESQKKYKLVRGDLEVITKSIQSFDNVLNCVQHVRTCIPQLTSHVQADSWNYIMISNLNSILIQETHARQTIRQCFTIICDVTQNTLKLQQLLKAERVPFAKKRFPNALSKLIDNINVLQALETVAINQLEKRTETIFNLPGAGALSILDQIKLVDAQLKKCNRQKDDILAECENKKVNMENLEPLIEVQEQVIRAKQLDIYELNLKLAKFQQINTHLKLVINGSVRAKNYQRAHYHQHVLKSKLCCMQTYTTIKNKKQNELDELVTILSEYKAKYECEKASMKILGTSSVTTTYLESKLAKLYEDVNKIENEKLLFVKHQEELGIKGDEYVNFLVNLRRLAVAIKLECNSYAPIISVLNEIKWLIQCPIELISSEEENDVKLAERLLLRNAEFLCRFSSFVRRCVTDYHHKRGWLIESEIQICDIKF